MSVLDGLRVIDLADGVAGQYATRLLAEHGAQVTLVEPPDGSATRRLGPFRKTGAGAGGSYLFWHLNTGKQGVCLETTSDAGARAFAQIAASADVVVLDGSLALPAGAASRIVCRIVDFRAGGPYANWRGSEMIHQALSGLMYQTGRADERPLYGFGHRAYYATGVAACASILAALALRDATGEGADLTVSTHETAVAMSQNLVAQYDYNGTQPVRGRYPGAVDIFRCADGWVTFYCRGDRWKAWCTALGALDAATDPMFAGADAILRNWDRAAAMLAPHVAKLTAAEFVARTHAARALAARVHSLGDILRCEHLATRDFWQSVETPAGRRTILGPVFRMHGTPRAITGGAPGS